VSWFGFETDKFYPHGLWGATNVSNVLGFLRQNGFNAIRVPFSAELALKPNDKYWVGDSGLDNLGNVARLAKFVDLCASFDMLVRECRKDGGMGIPYL
jgi:aryl-phospho-beta-D-glucosidase BglC (GH1 family)